MLSWLSIVINKISNQFLNVLKKKNIIEYVLNFKRQFYDLQHENEKEKAKKKYIYSIN